MLNSEEGTLSADRRYNCYWEIEEAQERYDWKFNQIVGEDGNWKQKSPSYRQSVHFQWPPSSAWRALLLVLKCFCPSDPPEHLNFPDLFTAAWNSKVCTLGHCSLPWDPGCRSQPGAPTAPSHEAVPRQTQPAGLFVANNWFSFFPSVPEWSTARFWLLEICVCEMRMTVLCKWVSCSGLPISDWGKLFLIICYFSWMTGLASHRALSLIPDWIAPKRTWSTPFSPHKPSWEHISHALLFVLCSCQCVFVAGKEQECCPTCRAAHCLQHAVSTSPQHLLDGKHGPIGTVRWGQPWHGACWGTRHGHWWAPGGVPGPAGSSGTATRSEALPVPR